MSQGFQNADTHETYATVRRDGSHQQPVSQGFRNADTHQTLYRIVRCKLLDGGLVPYSTILWDVILS